MSLPHLPSAAALAGALTLTALLLGADAAAAPCIESGSDQPGAEESGCTKCAADGTRCETCNEKWVLTPSGQCAQCDAPTIGPHAHLHRCLECKADDPTFCLKCEDYCNSRGCTGYFVTSEGHCSVCPAGAAACDDLTGAIQTCRAYYGLVGGECRRCKDDLCERCDGDLSVCTECQIPHVQGKEGLYPDPATGLCKPCGSGCCACNGPGACLECANTVLNPATQACPPCTDPNCLRCRGSLASCDICSDGFRLDGGGSCTACPANCTACDATGSCVECTPAYGLVQNECKRCAAADAGCVACDGDPAVCRGCANETFPDPAAGGACVACRVAGCTLCQQDDANRCEDSGVFCINGTHFSNVTGTCLPCKATGCWACTNDTPNRCDSCAAGFYREQATGDCKPCADPACEACDVSQGAACDRCSEGHYLDSSTKVCKPCSDPEGAKYETCKGGLESPPPGGTATERSARD